MGNLKLGDWVEETPGYSPEIGGIGAVSFHGDDYTTVIMPDGREWLASNIRSTLIAGYEVNNNAANRLAYGRLYRRNDIVAATLPEGWRVQTIADVDGLFAAITAAQLPSPTVSASLKSIGTTYWDQAFGTDVYGFGFNGAGWKDAAYPNWYNFRQHGYFAVADPTASKVQYRIISSATGTGEWFNTDSNTYAFSYRLVRDVVPVPPTYSYGTHDLLVLPSGLAETTDSLAQCIDIRLRTFLGEHWLNPELGVPWFRDFLTKAPDLAVCRQVLWDTILGVRGVRAINRLDLSIAKATRVLTVTFAVNGTDSFTSTITV